MKEKTANGTSSRLRTPPSDGLLFNIKNILIFSTKIARDERRSSYTLIYHHIIIHQVFYLSDQWVEWV